MPPVLQSTPSNDFSMMYPVMVTPVPAAGSVHDSLNWRSEISRTSKLPGGPGAPANGIALRWTSAPAPALFTARR